MNLPIRIPDTLELSETMLSTGGEIYSMMEILEAHADYFAKPKAVLDLISDLLVNGSAEIGLGFGAVTVTLEEWGLTPTP